MSLKELAKSVKEMLAAKQEFMDELRMIRKLLERINSNLSGGVGASDSYPSET